MKLFIQFKKPSDDLTPYLVNGIGNAIVYGTLGSALAAIAYFGLKSAGYSKAVIYSAMALPAIVGVMGAVIGVAYLVASVVFMYYFISALSNSAGS